MPATLVVFWVFAGAAIASALLCITRRNTVASALWLVVTLFDIAALFVMLDAQFIAVLQILVYAGAIMVLFLFVIMLLNLGPGTASDVKGPVGFAIATVLAAALGIQLLALLRAGPPAAAGDLARAGQSEGMIAAVARPLFTVYLVPFEITGLLLLAAIVGAVVLAKRQL
ncbi:MAG TPA: NADH-quinone oxidoreductase subunit J [Gemmatimonadales bacterium]|nr:NADH-quinone oxidoreductase subunit J [Gemmatimonadales bacterium]